MKRGEAVGLALTWDGARWPRRALPKAALAFLAKVNPAPPAARLASLLAKDRVKEIRICWVPRLKGGEETLAMPFSTPNGLRISYHAAKSQRFGDVLGVTYRRL